MIEQPGLSGQLKIFIEQEMTMLKTISAALLATSLIAAPTFAAGAKNTATPTAQTQTKADAGAKADLKTSATTNTNTKSKALNANAKMRKHPKKHVSHLRYHKQHKVAALKTKTHAKIQAKAPAKSSAKVGFKQAQPVSKRG